MPEGSYRLVETTDGTTIKLFRIFIYNRGFNASDYRLGIKYNEDWADIQRTHRGKHVIYPDQGDVAATIDNWKNSVIVNALKYHTDVPFTGKGMGEGQVLHIKWEVAKIIIPYVTDVDVYIDRVGDYKWIEITETITEHAFIKKK